MYLNIPEQYEYVQAQDWSRRVFSMVSTSLCSLVTLLGALWVSATPYTPVKRDTFPDYVLANAPYTWLYSGEGYWPSDVAQHIQHVEPEINNTVQDPSVTLTNVSSYGPDVYLTSLDDQSKHASIDWIVAAYGKPDSTGHSAAAPATIIVAEKDGGIVDAFYFYFYSYNFGPAALGQHFGNHVGDWEHTMIRFVNGEPQYFYYSTHDGGEAYNFSAIEKTNGRPTVYVATGSHASYATPGDHAIITYVPSVIVHDSTDKGFFWDVTQNYRGFWYDVVSQEFTSSGGAGQGGSLQEDEGTDWLKFLGRWGDAQWPITRPGQLCVLTQCVYTGGPTGPFGKNLERQAVCQYENDCTIKEAIRSDQKRNES